jgi:TonB-linked SusC/RagA family outer membrane protein
MDSKALYAPPFVNRRMLTETLLIMRITAFLLLAASLQVTARGFGQTVTLSVKDAPLSQVFDQVKRQTGLSFFWDEQTLKGTHPVTLDLKNATLEQALDACLEGQSLTYHLVENLVIIKPKQPSTPDPPSLESSTPPGEIHGRVTGAGGIPLSGANIIIKRTKRGQQTNANGEFVIKNVNADDILIISFIGYKTQNLKVGTGVDFPVVLEETKNELDKVVIQAYGTTTQRLNTGNIATVTAAEIERQPVMNPLLALEGKIPGVIVTPKSGYSSSPIKIEIRGRSVIDGGQPSEPLYIIDGVPLTVLNLSGANYATGSNGFAQGMNGPAGGQSPFFSVNPQDIESITVLKDADATAIYGSRGANGVIIVTTKTGKAGKTKFDMNAYEGESMLTGRYDLLNTQQYLMMRREAFKNDQATYGLVPGLTIPNVNNAYDILTWDTTRYTDLQKIYWDGIGHTTDIELSISGGDKQNTFRIGGSYHQETSVMSRSGADQRASSQFNYTHKSLDQRLSFSLTSFYSFTQSDLISVGGSVLAPPDVPPIFNSEANLNWIGWQPVSGNVGSWSSLFQPYDAKTGFLNSHLSLQYEIMKGLSFSTQLGYSTTHGENYSLTPIISLNPINSNPRGQSAFSNTNVGNSIVEPQLEYKRIVGKGKLNVLAGASNQSVSSDDNAENGIGYVNDNLLRSLNNAPIKYAFNGIGQYKYAALFARVNYNLSDEYLLNLSARRDGSSRFGPGKQYGNFWSVGAAWIFTEEDWFKRHLPGLSFGKLRASYGLTGNDQIGDYGFLTQWTANGGTPYQGSSNYEPIQHANPNLQWETNYKLEGALDLGFFKDRLTSEVAWYRNRCGNQLVSFPLPNITGFQYVSANSPALIQNTGWEMTLRGKIIETKDFNWSANVNIGFNRNKLVAYPNLSQSPYAALYTLGQSLSIQRLLHYTGVDPQTGQYTYYDKNHNGEIDYRFNNGNNDLYNKDLAIPFDGGLGTDLYYRKWQLNMYFQFRKQVIRSSLFANYPGTISNQSIEVLNRWQKPGDHAQFARFTTRPQQSDNNFILSDGVYTDGSYFRLRNLSLSYELPGDWIKKAGLQKSMIYARAQNIFKITRYPGIDPDSPGLGSLPPAKVFILGIQFIF